MDLRIGQGIDSHQFIEGRPLILGGVEVPHSHGLKGHSDGDALLHAVTDALLGAVGKGDIGTHFPDTDLQWKDADSKIFLREVWKLVRADGWSLINVDSTVITEQPKLAPHIQQMKESIAELLEATSEQVGLKATTAEKMGSLGRGEGLTVTSVVLLSR